MAPGQQVTVAKPSRSDEVVDADRQIKIADQIRAQFDSAAPKRPMKPNRSEPDPDSSNHADPVAAGDNSIPELHKFRNLHSQPIPLQRAVATVQDEFVETQYYDQLDSIDKQHHTTGTGFIRVEREAEAVVIVNGEIGKRRVGFRSNPATNDWVPSLED